MHQQSTTLNWAIGDYVLESVVRAGGRATVYTARRHGADGLRALKLIAIGTDPNARTIVEAERRGAELQQEFARHYPLVPWVEEIGEARACLYIAMELVSGEDLSDALGRGPLSQARALEIALELVTFLEKTHHFEVAGRAPERIIHADLKPGNVRVRPDGHIRVLDFGIAKAMAERRLETTQKWGTRQYMSPEWLHTGHIDEQVDYWSLGVLLYEMLAGYRPFRRFERHDNVLEDAIRRRERPEALPSGIDLALQRVVARLLAGEVRQRYANAAEIRVALEACHRPGAAAASRAASGAALVAAAGAIGAGVANDAVYGAAAVAPFALGALGVADIATQPVSLREDVPTEPVRDTRLDSAKTEAFRADGSSAAAAVGAGVPDSPPTEPVPMPGAASAARMGAAVAPFVPPPLPSSALPSSSSLSASALPPVAPYALANAPATDPVPSVAAAAAAVTASGKKGAAPKTGRKLIATVLWIAFAWILASEGIACIAAERLRSDAAVANEHDLDAALKRRTQLAGWSLFNCALHLRADPVIKDRLVSLADGVIANYRQEQPTVARPDWEQARGWLTSAVGLYPDNDRLLSKLRYTEGHLQRLTGSRRVEGNGAAQTKAARQSYYSAIQKFQEAAALDPQSPDPYLGLAQTYIYGLGDVDSAVDAQHAAEKRGYRLNRRERASLGDGYRARAERTWRSARDLEGDQQRDAYDRAQKDFKRCVESFAGIVEFANAADQLHRCEARLAEMDNHSTPWWRRLFGSGTELEIHLPELSIGSGGGKSSPAGAPSNGLAPGSTPSVPPAGGASSRPVPPPQ